MEGWLAYLTELGIPDDNPTWVKFLPALEIPEPLMFYLPMILSGFDEEEYMNRLKEVMNAVFSCSGSCMAIWW